MTRNRRLLTIVLAGMLFVLFAAMALAMGGVSFAEAVLAASAAVLVYIVVRLSQTMYTADPAHRRRARRGLVLAATVPVLVLAPVAIGASPPELTSVLLAGAAVWLAIAMAFTSYVLARAGHAAHAQGDAAGRRRHKYFHMPQYSR